MRKQKSAVRAFLCVLLALLLSLSLTPGEPLAAEVSSSSQVTVSGNGSSTPANPDTNSSETVSLWPAAPEISTPNAIVMDADTGAILYDKAMDEVRYPASITKVLTALLIIENKPMTDEVAFGEQAVSESIPGNARINVKLGEVLNTEQCLYAILLASANEVCTQMAIDIAGSVEAFADMMNQRAAAIGCTNTHFTNPNGLPDPNHYTTAHDMALILGEAIKNETFCQIEANLTYTIPPTNMTAEPRELRNHHPMLFQDDPAVGYEGAFAGKTGYTDDARHTLVTAARRNDMTLLCVVMYGDNPNYVYDTITLLDYGFANFTHCALESSETETIQGSLTVPVNITTDQLTFTDSDPLEGENTFQRSYTLEGHPVGTASIVENIPEQEEEPSDSSASSASSELPSKEEPTSESTGILTPAVRILIGINIVVFIILILVLVMGRKRKRKRSSK